MEALVALQDELVGVVKLGALRAVEQIDYASNFLTELGKDLSGMEKHLFTYQDFNRETHLLNGKFHDDLLSHSNEMNQAFSSGKGFEDTRNLIASKLMTIGLAIEIKRQEDEVKFQEAESKIAELQTSVRNYNDQITQVTERANSLEKEVLLDSLLEIHNRRAYELQIRESLRRYHRGGEPFSLILIDVDRFKIINDQYGHNSGDKCLREIAKIIRCCLRKSDFLGRYGGEELVAILEGTGAEDGGKIAEKIRIRIEKATFCYRDEVIPVTISLGVTEVMQTDQDSETPFSRADNAMYQAKSQGRNRVCVMKQNI
jgi:diguanylate cyclase